MSCSYGDSFHLTVFGQSHADCIGVVIDGIPAGVTLDSDLIRAMPARRAPGITLKTDYFGFIVPDEFVVGYGLDYAERYRNLPYIGVLKPEVYENN